MANDQILKSYFDCLDRLRIAASRVDSFAVNYQDPASVSEFNKLVADEYDAHLVLIRVASTHRSELILALEDEELHFLDDLRLHHAESRPVTPNQ